MAGFETNDNPTQEPSARSGTRNALPDVDDLTPNARHSADSLAADDAQTVQNRIDKLLNDRPSTVNAHDFSIDSQGLAGRRHKLPPMVLTNASSQFKPGVNSDKSGSGSGSTTQLSTSSSAGRSALNSFSPGDFTSRRLNSLISDATSPDDDWREKAATPSTTSLGETLLRSTTVPPPYSVLAILIKIELLPVLQLLNSNPLPPSELKRAYKQAQNALSLARHYGMDEATVGRCSYYIGVVEFLFARVNGNGNVEVARAWFEVASRAVGAFHEGEWARLWPGSIEEMQRTSTEQRQESSRPKRHPRSRDPAKMRRRAERSEKKVMEKTSPSFEWVKNQILDAKAGVWGAYGRFWHPVAADQPRRRGTTTVEGSAEAGGSSRPGSNDVQDHHGVKFTKNQPYGLNGLVKSPEDFREEKKEDSNLSPVRDTEGSTQDAGATSSSSSSTPEEQLWPESPPTCGPLRVVNWTSQDASSGSAASGGGPPLSAPPHGKKGFTTAHETSIASSLSKPGGLASGAARSFSTSSAPTLRESSHHHHRRVSLREMWLPGLSVATGATVRADEAMAEEGYSPTFQTSQEEDGAESGLRKGSIYGEKKSPETLAEEGSSRTFKRVTI